ncbi:hypothetical protein QLX08_011173 [Tetragonisca angustula]|uniref:Uncharacterized protein n=1 Tax=Tetragonisca angustula TaxID=166442 RepID=A0AAW0Z924_9HYME
MLSRWLAGTWDRRDSTKSYGQTEQNGGNLSAAEAPNGNSIFGNCDIGGKFTHKRLDPQAASSDSFSGLIRSPVCKLPRNYA